MAFDVENIRRDFPLLTQTVYGKPLVYLDSGATAQKPLSVIEREAELYKSLNANIHRGVHHLSDRMTALYEQARVAVREFIGAAKSEEIIFTAGATASINLVAYSWSERFLSSGDNIVISHIEHHSNIVPWQLLQSRIGFKIRVIPMLPDGSLDMEAFKGLINGRTRLVSVCHASNVLGTVNPIKEIARIAHSHGITVVVDGAQSVPHLKVDVADLDADFYAFSAHKMYGPAGVGVLFGRRELLEKMPPYQGGGEMIANVTFEHTTFAELPFKFEAGTPDFVGIAALHTAIDYMQGIGIDAIAAHEHDLLQYTTERMADIPGMRIFGTAPGKSAVISFLIGDAHHYDTGLLLDKLGIAVRTGHHCAQPLMHALGIEGTVRASFALYNTREEADAFIAALKRVAAMLQ